MQMIKDIVVVVVSALLLILIVAGVAHFGFGFDLNNADEPMPVESGRVTIGSVGELTDDNQAFWDYVNSLKVPK